MVFNIPPHNNREVPLYFLQNLYVEFVMGKHVNYFDVLGFEGVGKGSPKIDPMLGIEMPIDIYLHPVANYRGHMSLLYMI